MLKLVLEPGDNLDRSLSAAARQLERIVEEGIKEGYVRVRAYPRPDVVVASAAILSMLYSFGIKPLFKVSVRQPSSIDIPTILLGYNNPNYKSRDVSSSLLSVSLEANNPPPPSATYISGQGSVPAMLGLMMSKAGASYGRREYLLLLFSAAYWGGFIEKTGKMHGLDKLLYDALVEADTGLEILNTLKVYKPMSMTLCQAISKTIDPYYPGLTGDPEGCVDLLQGNGAGDLVGRVVATLKREELEKAALIILSHIREVVGRDVDVGEYVAGLTLSRVLNFDPRLRANSILYAIDLEGDLTPIVSIASQLDTVIEKVEDYHIEISSYFADIVDGVKLVKTKVQPWIRGYKIVSESKTSPLFMWRALKLSGRISDSPLLFEVDGKLCASTLQVEEALGYGEAKKLVDVKAVEEVGLSLCVKESA